MSLFLIVRGGRLICKKMNSSKSSQSQNRLFHYYYAFTMSLRQTVRRQTFSRMRALSVVESAPNFKRQFRKIVVVVE